MKKKLTDTLMRELIKEGYTAIIGAGQLDNDHILYIPSKEPIDSITMSTNSTPFAEDDIIILSEHKIDSTPEDFFEGKEVEIS